MHRSRPWLLARLLVALGLFPGCNGPTTVADSGATDASARDAGNDAAAVDVGAIDSGADAAMPDDVGVDAGACPRAIFRGDTEASAQGWTMQSMAPFTVTPGADDLELATTTTTGAHTGGELVLLHPDALVPGEPFHVEVVLEVVATTGHNPLDAAVALLPSFQPPFGTQAERAQMIYLDAARIGWADDTASFATDVVDGAFHTLGLAVDAAGEATVTWDGTLALTRSGVTTNGTLAIGDQTNEPSLDATIRLRSVTLLCP